MPHTKGAGRCYTGLMDLLERLKQIVQRYEEMVANYDRELAEFELHHAGDLRLLDAIRSTRAAALKALELARDSLRREQRFRLRQMANRSRAPFAALASAYGNRAECVGA